MDPDAVAVASLVIGVAALLVAVVAVPAARPLALVIALFGMGVAAYFLFAGGGPGPGPTPGPSTDEPSGPSLLGPSISVSPRSATAGAQVTVTGSGFPPDSGVAFGFANDTGQDFPIDGYAVVDAEGRFRTTATLTAPVCDRPGRILAFSGTNDRRPDPSGPVNEPVAEATVTVACP